MKKQIAIFAFAVFFLAQFGRVINFCLCKTAAYQQTKTFICDCEKQLYTAVKTANRSREQSPQNISTHQHVEELFHFSNSCAFITSQAFFCRIWPISKAATLYHIFGNNIFHPPLQLS